jgi:glycosyltransferase involved in cell wall biosynthesis
MMPRILHLGATDIEGGAARGAYWLHQAMVRRGMDSRMLVDRKYADDDSVIAPANGGRVMRRLRAYADALPLMRYRRTGDSYWSVNWVPSRIDRVVRALEPDIIHLHWAGGGFLPIDAMARFRRPVVWTLRDMWPFTGGCHYTAGCERYREGCGLCPQLRSDKADDLSRSVFERKRRHWRDMPLTLVPISTWLAEAARSSPLFGDAAIEVIPNGLDLTRFHPLDTAAARRAWNLPPERKLILFGALHATKDRRKGYPELCRAIDCLARDGLTENATLLVFGADDGGGAPPPAMDARFLGHVEDDRQLARLYAAADVMVAPSLQEAFGKTLIEAMACATPVVAFDRGGPADIVEHRRTGYLAQAFEPEDLAAGIAWCLAEKDRPERLGLAAHTRATTLYDIEAVAERYAALYRRIHGAAPREEAA